ncbi:hypothetical protein F5Y08DRAFT_331249 [Xylaria arbuscula]|nr:hypothetical protein F5Y08DRAFT_331249 [Xylaria arbuscula]
MTRNHTNFQARLDFVQRVLHERLDLQVGAEITPLQYDPECPFKYNNFVYHIKLPSPINPGNDTKHHALQPGCVSIPHGTEEFIMRLANPNAEGMSPETRVENEVAMINLAAAALNSFQPSVVPSVYAWGSAATEAAQGWIIQQLMPGKSVDESFGSMTLDQKKAILSQKAALLKALQDYQLPDSITGYGGVTYDEGGRIISAAMPTLRRADANPYIKGWHANGIRERLDNFVKHGLPSQFQFLQAPDNSILTILQRVATNNLLFDPASLRITALLDFDFSCIMHHSYEFLRSFDGAGGQFRGWSGDETSEQAVLRNAKLHGFPSPLPLTTGVNWEVAKAWEDELERQSVKRPRTIEGIDKVADVDTVLRTILPWRVSNSDILRMRSEKVIIKCKEENEQQLIGLLERLGF